MYCHQTCHVLPICSLPWNVSLFPLLCYNDTIMCGIIGYLNRIARRKCKTQPVYVRLSFTRGNTGRHQAGSADWRISHWIRWRWRAPQSGNSLPSICAVSRWPQRVRFQDTLDKSDLRYPQQIELDHRRYNWEYMTLHHKTSHLGQIFKIELLWFSKWTCHKLSNGTKIMEIG